VAEDVIRAQRIELVDTDGNLSIVVDGGSTTEGGAPGLIVYGPDGPASSIAFNVDRESGKASAWPVRRCRRRDHDHLQPSRRGVYLPHERGRTNEGNYPLSR
jgi:hypothetical protein